VPNGWLGEKIRMYQFCRTFRVSSEEYYTCLAEDVDILNLIEQEIRKKEIEDLEKNARRHN